MAVMHKAMVLTTLAWTYSHATGRRRVPARYLDTIQYSNRIRSPEYSYSIRIQNVKDI